MEKIKIFWGDDEKFEEATENLKDILYLGDIFDHINKTIFKIEGFNEQYEPPLEVENLVIHTDDYGGLKEWALLGFSKNILQNQKVDVKNLWICNPPTKIYKDILRNYDRKIIAENRGQNYKITIDDMKKMSCEFNDNVIGQPHVMEKVLSSIYALRNEGRKRPVSLLFLGDSGIGKTETAKYIGSYLGGNTVRIQFSMQQTNNAYQYIFGANHSEDSLARELIRRNSNVILLDEFDKVSPTFYNAFYQMFDEGIYVDANYTVDVSKCIIICTTNYMSVKEAERKLGTPIYSRFSKVIIFNPISKEDRLTIARNCYEKLMNQVDDEDKNYIKDNSILSSFEKSIVEGSYSNMRMLKNDIEDAINYEILKARGIIHKNLV